MDDVPNISYLFGLLGPRILQRGFPKFEGVCSDSYSLQIFSSGTERWIFVQPYTRRSSKQIINNSGRPGESRSSMVKDSRWSFINGCRVIKKVKRSSIVKWSLILLQTMLSPKECIWRNRPLPS
jgi:hypothetical protein